MGCRAPDPRIAWIVDVMHRRMAEPLSVPRLARLVHLSPSRMTALFAAQLGTPPMQFLRRLRLRRARLLIDRTFLTVTEIRTLVGYDDPRTLTRDFSLAH